MHPNSLNLFRESYRDETPWPFPVKGGGGSAAMYVLLEDMPSGHGASCDAMLYGWDQNAIRVVRLYNWGNPSTGGAGLLDRVRAGYWGSAILDNGRWRHDNGPCQDDYRCTTLGFISASPIAGTVDVPYAYQVGTGGLNNDVSASGLPVGLTINETGNITGTPTTAGEYRITITASAPKDGESGDCTITIRTTIVINEA